MASCKSYASPKEAMVHGPREQLLYVTCVSCTGKEPDVLATVDVDPKSPTYCQIIHRLLMPVTGDELHHSGWNACISCKGRSRSHLILPCLQSDRIYIVDTISDPKKPRLHKTVEGSVLHKLGLGAPHTSHCLPSGEVLISCMGDAKGDHQGGFLLLGPDFQPRGRWEKQAADFGYDFWYQPRMGVLVSSAWGAPAAFRAGFRLEDVAEGRYGSQLTIWEWGSGKPLQTLQLGPMPLEVRFLHNPERAVGFVGCALDASVFHFHRDEPSSQWQAEKILSIPPIKVNNWMLPEMPGLITDILISLDDRYLYLSNWTHGEVLQYDVSDPAQPRLAGRVLLGGLLCKGGAVATPGKEQPERPKVKGRSLLGGPQMLQLSLDGKRLYVTDSLFKPWDSQFYPDILKHGSVMVRVSVDTENGGLSLDHDFLVEFGRFLAHEMRYPGGDCTSDIWT